MPDRDYWSEAVSGRALGDWDGGPPRVVARLNVLRMFQTEIHHVIRTTALVALMARSVA